MFRKAREDQSYLRRCLPLPEYDLGHAGTQRAMMINLGEPQILEGEMAQA